MPGGTGGGAVAELEVGFSDHGDFAQCFGDARGTRVFEERGVQGFRICVELLVAEFAEVVFQVEEAVAVDGIVPARGFLGCAVG